nr:hypothetical protein [Burkholderia cepacia]
MPHTIPASVTASVSELKRNPTGTVAAGEGFPVAILSHNEPAFYCIPAKTWEAMENVSRISKTTRSSIRAPMGKSSRSNWLTFEFALLEPALKAWKKLDRTVRDRFEARLAERLENPRIPSARPCDTRCGFGVSRLVSSNRPVPPVRPSLPAHPASFRRRRG